ncbi:MAG: endolytic transglycosylase MltG, partial [Gammaproteobacteria bacterium]
IASIQAALAGSAHDSIYFVAMGEGRSHFSLTLDEHNAAVRKYQLKR